MKSILILGGGVMQLPAIRTALERGWKVIVADVNPAVPGAGLAHHFEPVDLKDREAMLAMARNYREGSGLDGVFTAGTDFSATVAYVANHLGLPGIPFEAAVRASNKTEMRRTFRDAGVPSPAFRGLHRDDDPLPVLDSLKFPLVVKPVDNMGARGISRVDSPEELVRAFAEAGRYSRSGQVILEEYIIGPEFSLDALVEEGQITLCGFADRHIFFEPFFIEMGHTMPTSLSQKDQDRVFETFCRGVRALGITVGAAKGDMKLGPDGPVVGEIAARLSGGFMSGWTFPYASGVDLTGAALNLAVGLPAGDLSPRRREFSAERAFISLPGEIDSLTGFREAEKGEGILFSHLRVGPGDRITFPRNNVEKGGNFISRAESREKAMFQAEEACRQVDIRLKPADKETEEFLAGRSYLWVPPAYGLTDPENLRYAAGLSGGCLPAGEGIPEAPALAPLPFPSRESGTDWHGLSFGKALERVLDATGARWGLPESYDLGGVFWKAFLRGGVQGGIWIIRTALEASSGGTWGDFLKKW